MSPIIPEVEDSEHVPSLDGGPSRCGGIFRLDLPVPFFLDNDVFTNFKRSDYTWGRGNEKKTMVVLVGKDKRALMNVPAVVPKEVVEDYSIGGCPLECPFDLNEDFKEAIQFDIIPLVFDGIIIPKEFIRLQVDDGHVAIAKVLKQVEPFNRDLKLAKSDQEYLNDNKLVCALVDGAARGGGLTFIGCRRPFISADVHVMGKHKPDSNLLSMSTFKRYHEDNLFVENRPMTKVAHAVYEKLHGEFPSRGKVYLEFVFKEPTGVFEMPPEDSLSKIAIRPLPGDANPSMTALWEELQDLERWTAVLLQCSKTKIADCSSFLNTTIQEVSEATDGPAKAIQDLLAREPVLDIHRTNSSIEFSDSLDFVLKRVVKQQRADCDFTDRLWSIVRKCENLDELRECLQLIYQSVSNKMYRPYILLSNTTKMATTLTNVMKGDMTGLLQMIHPDVMVRMVIECGLAKLFKDYNFALAMSHLIERGQVDDLAPKVDDILTSVQNLEKLHCILEVMCLCKERLTLSVNCQEMHVRKMLHYFASNPLDWEHIHHFDVPSSDLRGVMSGLHPIYFKVKIESQTFLKWATTTVVVSPEDYIRHRRDDEGIEESGTRQYYVYLYCESGRKTE